MIVVQNPDGRLAHYDTLGYVVMVAMLVTVVMLYPIHRAVREKMGTANRPVPPPAPASVETPSDDAAVISSH